MYLVFGFVFLKNGLLGFRKARLKVGEYGYVVFTSIAENVVLYLVILQVGELVEPFKPFLCCLVNLDVVAHALAVLAQHAVYAYGECQTNVAVYLGFVG